MIFFAVTKPKRKISIMLKLLLLALLLGILVPYFYNALASAGAMQNYVQTMIQSERTPGEPIRVESDDVSNIIVKNVWYQVRNLLTGEELITDLPVNNTYLP